MKSVKVNVYLTDLGNFVKVNEAMARYFTQPYPARAVVGVAALPRGALVEVDGVMEINTLEPGARCPRVRRSAPPALRAKLEKLGLLPCYRSRSASAAAL